MTNGPEVAGCNAVVGFTNWRACCTNGGMAAASVPATRLNDHRHDDRDRRPARQLAIDKPRHSALEGRLAFDDFGPYADAVQERDDHLTAIATDKGLALMAINGPLVSRTLER